MDEVFDHPTTREAEDLAFRAELSERRGDLLAARGLYADAARLEFEVALSISGRPHARAVLAIGTVCLHARAGRFDLAVQAAERFLAEPGSLTDWALEDLRTLLREYRATQAVITVSPREDVLIRGRRELREQAKKL